MSRSKIIIATIVMMLAITSFAFVADASGTDADGENDVGREQWDGFLENLGTRTFEEGWIPIFGITDLGSLESGQKYLLVNDIDLTNFSLPDSFFIEMNVTRDDEQLTVSFSIVGTSGKTAAMEVSELIVFVNGESVRWTEGKAEVSFDIAKDVFPINVSAAGTVTNIDAWYDREFVVSVSFEDGESGSKTVNSKGNFEPLGTPSEPFSGTIDGNGHVITGLRTTSYSADEMAFSGLIAWGGDLTIRNLGLEGGSAVTISEGANTTIVFAGGLVGFTCFGITEIINSYNTGDVISEAKVATVAGGLIGYDRSETTIITNSYNKGNVISEVNSEQYTVASAGGLVGFTESKTIQVTNSYNTGTITSRADYLTSAGGLIGGVDPLVEEVTITGSCNKGAITSSTSIKAPTTKSAEVNAGGLVGKASSEITRITNSYNAGNISSDVHVEAVGVADTGAYADAYAGGLIGFAESKTIQVNNSYSTGDIGSNAYASAEAEATMEANATARTRTYVGGLIGYAYSDEIVKLTVTNSYNKGNVGLETYSGAFAYADGEGSKAGVDAKPVAYGGGLIGYVNSGETGELTLTNSYSAGSMTWSVFIELGCQGDDRETSHEQTIMTGGLIGSVESIEATINNCYIQEGNVEKLVGNIENEDEKFPTSGERSEVDMKKQETFVDWNFSTVWKIDANKNDGYPYLDPIGRWENFIVNEGEDYDPESDGEDWIGLTNENFMDIMQDAEFELDGKYYLKENIDLTHEKAPGTFDIGLKVEITIEKKIVITLNYNDTLIQVSKAVIFLNGTAVWIGGIDQATATFTFEDIPKELRISAGGIVKEGVADIGGETFTISTTILSEDVDSTTPIILMSQGNFIPLGTPSKPFTGTIDGNGYVISGLRTTSYRTDAAEACSGLIAYGGDGVTIKNLGLEGGSSIAISAGVSEGEDVEAYAHAGGLIGYVESGTAEITNSYNIGSVASDTYERAYTDADTLAYAGGLIGYVNSEAILVTNAYNVGSVTSDTYKGLHGNASGTAKTYARAGGLIGCVYSEIAKITNSYNMGNVTSDAHSYASTWEIATTYAHADAGGLIGYAEIESIIGLIIANSYNKGDVTSDAKAEAYVGNLLANSASVDADAVAYTGGLVGYAISETMRIINSYNTGDVTLDVHAFAYVDADVSKLTFLFKDMDTHAYAGGLIGHAYSSKITIFDSYIQKVQEGEGHDNNLVGNIENEEFPLSGERSEAEMKKQETFVDWNFSTVWKIDANENEGYPYLYLTDGRWENFIVDEGEDYDPESDGEDWIGLTNENFMDIMQDAEFKPDGKYYLKENIDLTHEKALGTFDIELKVKIIYMNNMVNMAITLSYNGDPIPVSEAVIFLNGTAVWIDGTGQNNEATATFTFTFKDIPKELRISAGGIVKEGVADIGGETFTISTITLSGDVGSTTSITLMSQGNFIPLGTLSKPFTGTIDGNGYVISGLRTTSYRTDAAEACSGLIAYGGDGVTIKNLGLEGGSSIAISAGVSEGEDVEAYAHAGGLIGYVESGTAEITITNSYNTGNITSGAYADAGADANANAYVHAFAGGLIGNIYSGTTELTITNSYNKGDITSGADADADASMNAYAYAHAGGLIGYVNSKTTQITNSYNTGNITSDAPVSVYAFVYAGGLIGYVESGTAEITITNSYNTGNITSDASVSVYAFVYAGGLIGDLSVYSKAEISNTYNVGEIVANSSGGKHCGGLVGFVYKGLGTATADINSSYFESEKGAVTLIGNGDEKATVSNSGIKDAEDMKKYTEFFEWDFTTIWRIDKTGERNQGYPYHDLREGKEITIGWSQEGEGEITFKVGGEIYLGSLVAPGSNVTIEMTPAECYGLASLSINGKDVTDDVESVEGAYVYEIDYILESLDVVVCFKSDLYIVTASMIGEGGSLISPSTVGIKGKEGVFEFNVSPDAGYYVDEVTISSEGKAKYNIDSNKIILSEVLGDCDMTFTMSDEIIIEETQYNVKVTSTPGGTTNPSGTTKVSKGDSMTITISPDEGHRIMDVKVNGISELDSLKNGKLFLVNITKSMNVNVQFAEGSVQTVHLDVHVGEGGIVEGAGHYEPGTTVTLKATPLEGYAFVRWSNGSTDATISVTVAEDTDIHAIFEKISSSLDDQGLSTNEIILIFAVIVAMFGMAAAVAWLLKQKNS